MKKQKSRNIFKALIGFMVFALLVLPNGIGAGTAKAADKPYISSEETIGKGSINVDGPFVAKNDYQMLEVYSPVKKATYSFTTSDKSVVTVKTKGTKAYLTGLKAGTAKITCNQKLNGKTTKVGTCKVTVKNPVFGSDYSYDPIPVGSMEGFLIYGSYRNYDATYTYTSNSKDFTVIEKIEKEKGTKNNYLIKQTYTAKKPGKYTVTIKETYNKKTTKVGEISFVVKKATVVEENSMYVTESAWAFNLINLYRSDVDYLFDFGEEDIVEFYVEEGTVYYKGKKPGTVTVKIYEDVTAPDESKLIGSCKITVKENKIEDIEAYFYETETTVGGEPIGFEVEKYPSQAPEAVTVTSSDTKIATVSEIVDNYGEITPVSKGTVTITITCGEFTKTETITVNAAEDEEEYEEDYEEDEE
jgi:hypothetical protein